MNIAYLFSDYQVVQIHQYIFHYLNFLSSSMIIFTIIIVIINMSSSKVLIKIKITNITQT